MKLAAKIQFANELFLALDESTIVGINFLLYFKEKKNLKLFFFMQSFALSTAIIFEIFGEPWSRERRSRMLPTSPPRQKEFREDFLAFEIENFFMMSDIEIIALNERY